MIVALTGGVGGAKLADGLAQLLSPDELLIVVNTGDDFTHLGLSISRDLDTVMYTLAGLNNVEQGWGLAGETRNFMMAMKRLGGETWFNLGDQDLATHIERTRRLRGPMREPLSAITAEFCRRLGIRHRIVPMTDDPVRTMVETDAGLLAFQDYFVRLACQPVLKGLQFAGAKDARPATAFREALISPSLKGVVICPRTIFSASFPFSRSRASATRWHGVEHCWSRQMKQIRRAGYACRCPQNGDQNQRTDEVMIIDCRFGRRYIWPLRIKELRRF